MKKAIIKSTARILLLTLSFQLVWPVYSYALTTGPSQPEVQSFEPVGTTDMVDLFTGDFNYNIPLMDVEGFPINIAYHSGIGIEQEASWVGLGWNINPGEINRGVRGLPDDFNGETIDKKLHIKDENNYKVDLGVDASLEMFGFSPKDYGFDVSLGLGGYVNFNNYKGASVGFYTSATLKTPVTSTGITMGVGSQAGADIDLNASLHLPTSVSQDIGMGMSASAGTGFNSRSGMKDLVFGTSVKQTGGYGLGTSTYERVAIGLQNYVPVVTNKSAFNAYQFQVRVGGEVFYMYPNLHLAMMVSNLHFDTDGSRRGFGYLYSENADKEAILDFSRDKDGVYNKTLSNLPLASMTYDVYNACGQGTGGSFRLFRNDIGTIYDPEVISRSNNNSVALEVGAGGIAEVGADMTIFDNESKSGPWTHVKFTGNKPNSLYEKAYFKQAGELTYNNLQSAGNMLYNELAQYVDQNVSALIGKYGQTGVLPGNKTFDNGDRTSRASLLSYQTGAETGTGGLYSFTNADTSATVPRYGAGINDAKSHHISEMTQTMPDGRRYVYGVPALNHKTEEVMFNVDADKADINTGLVSYSGNDSTVDNNQGRENFYSATTTPAYAHSYLLSAVLSNDYVDIMGDGPTNDDIGDWTKINYRLYNDDYKWRAPYGASTAQYMPGFWCDKKDDKGSYIKGSRQVWHVNSIESKNYIAEFSTSVRYDGLGDDPSSKSYKLDSIKLYNKHDRVINGNNAVPIKTVIFKYNWDLCKGIPNTSNKPNGKLTLERIYIRYGNSDKNLLSPYKFSYNTPNPNYSFADKDRWGNYKKNDPALTNYEFPYSKQDGTGSDDTAASWNLTDIKLPSGGNIHVDYESDDYSFVQDRRAMQMVKIAGVGNSPNMVTKSELYESRDDVNDYVYFKRSSKEIKSMSLRDNYLQGNKDLLYYSFNLDISNTGRYENIKGYARVEALDSCPNNRDYCYIKLKRESAGKNTDAMLHPATIYGLNIGRYYLPHILYPGFKDGDGGNKKILLGLLDAAKSMMKIAKNPLVTFVESDKKAKNIKIEKSWLRLQIPTLTKKGGGIRVKELRIEDNWNTLASGVSASYGKKYDYTTEDKDLPQYGRFSSGVASYEPMVGGDENPFKMPVPYTADGGRLLPAIEFFQEEPFGEGFFPPPVVGYSKVTVTSIHKDEGKSSQSEEQHEFFTARDYPIRVDFTDKDAPNPVTTRNLRRTYIEVSAKQGYALQFNNMHGKPKAVNNYNIKTDGTNVSREAVSGIKYNYLEEAKGKLKNTVRALVRQRGTRNNYTISDGVSLGEEIDFTVDSRERDNRSFSRNIAMNLNAVAFAVLVIPIPTAFFPDKEEREIFHSMVSTKVIQRYGILQSVEMYEGSARTVTENMVYDAETGTVLLSRTNTHASDEYNYDLKYPAYLAYEGMGPAYTNIGYEEDNATLSIEDRNDNTVSCRTAPTYYGRLSCANKSSFSPGDELVLKYQKNNVNCQVKVWVIGEMEYGQSCPPSPSPYPRGYDSYPTSYYRVVPRALFKGGVLQWPQLTEGASATKVSVKVLRSGRRNNLEQNVQETRFADNPYLATPTFNQLFNVSNNEAIFGKILGVTVRRFTNYAAPYYSAREKDIYDHIDGTPEEYWPDIYPVVVGQDSILNRYVLGHMGTFRPYATYTYLGNRQYGSNYDGYSDGSFSMTGKRFWTPNNQNTVDRSILSAGSFDPLYWKFASRVSKYDVHGNAVEEVDATGKISAAQYGYNKELPVAVASNVRQRGFFFDGFEDYSILVPPYLQWLYKGSNYYQTPFSARFSNYVIGPVKYRQTYYYYNRVSSGDSITRTTSHTGSYSLLCSADRYFGFKMLDKTAGDREYWGMTNTRNFSMERDRKYIANIWLKSVNGSVPNPTGLKVRLISIASVGYDQDSTDYSFQVKTGSIDGWYMAEAKIDGGRYYGNSRAALIMPSGYYYDDIRFIPVDAGMKSFVYDPVSFKMIAQLDENNFASFYEYDQEGQLVRTKKETEKGIMTITESRRSNSKK